MVSALYGASAMGSIIVALIFFTHWRRSVDRLFLLFAWAFAILGVQYFVIAVTALGSEWQPYVFAIRLVAFLLILFAIAGKNQRAS
jgi:hypothetical protein